MSPSSRVGALLLACLLASQSAMLVLTPVLADVADDLDVDVATAGQLRTLSGLAAGIVAACVGLVAARVGLREMLLAGLLVIVAGSAASAAAPAFWLLAVAQVLVGVGIALSYSAAVAATVEWAQPADRPHVLAVALLGPPGAWVVALPIVGALGEVSWRAAWLLPLLLTLTAALAVTRRPRLAPTGRAASIVDTLTDPLVRRWAIGELFAFSGWAGALVYAGALLVETYGVTVAVAGLLLAAGALAYLPSNLIFRRLVVGNERRLLVLLCFAGGLTVTVMYAVHPAAWVTATLFALLSFVAGGRTLAGSSLGLAVAEDNRLGATGVRTAAMQFGYLVGASAGGVALALGGYAALGLTLGVLMAAAAVPHLDRTTW